MPPIMIPPQWSDPRSRRQAEQKVFLELQRQLPTGWTVFHDRAWVAASHVGRTPFIQVDFIIANPKWGVVVLEVKGGKRIWCENGVWKVQPHIGNADRYKLPPLKQAEEAAFALLRAMKEATANRFPSKGIVHAVCFPDVDVPPESLDASLPRAIVIDRSDLQQLPASLRRICNYWASQNVFAKGVITDQWIDAIRGHLARDIELAQLLAISIQIEQRELAAISEEQANIYYAATATRRLAIAGCAGSGKTMLATLLARKLARDGLRTLLCCYNRPLAEYLTGVTKGEADVHVETFHALCRDLAGKVDISFDINEAQASTDQLVAALDTAPHVRLKRYDAIIVDEGQDMDSSWWSIIERILTNPEQCPIFVFYDDNQRVYERPPGLPAGMQVLPLSKNFRNPHPIHEHVLYFYRNTPQPASSSRAGAAPQFRLYDGTQANALAATLRRVIDELRQGQVPFDQIVILTPYGVEASVLSDLEERLPISHTPTKGTILWTSVYSFKGLERPVVILAEIDARMEDDARLDTLLYVGYSRASSQLYVCHEQTVAAPALRPTHGGARRPDARIIEKLDRYQQDAVTAPLGRALVWAGAGSGKTETLTRRIAYLLDAYQIRPEEVVAVTFSRKAAKEMRRRLEHLLTPGVAARLTVGTFHRICGRMLREEIETLPQRSFYGRRTNFRVLDSDDQEVYGRRAIGKLSLEWPVLKAYIERQKQALLWPHETERADNTNDKLCRDAYDRYEQLLEDENAFDFNDLLLFSVRLLEEHPAVRARRQRRWRHLLSDEYQDTNGPQARLIELLARDNDGKPLADASLFVVGDAQQAIYGWRGSRLSYFTGFRTQYSDAQEYRLPINYRSAIPIIEVALAVADKSFTGVERLDLIPHRTHLAPNVTIVEHDTVEEEAATIAQHLHDIVQRQGINPREIAVLMRAM